MNSLSCFNKKINLVSEKVKCFPNPIVLSLLNWKLFLECWCQVNRNTLRFLKNSSRISGITEAICMCITVRLYGIMIRSPMEQRMELKEFSISCVQIQTNINEELHWSPKSYLFICHRDFKGSVEKVTFNQIVTMW